MWKRIAAIGFIFVCTAIAWGVLASTIFYRTYSSDSDLRTKVASSWGEPQEQSPPTATYVEGALRQGVVTKDGKEVSHTIDERQYIPLDLQKSRVHAALHADYRRKGLLWYSTYQVQFAGTFEFVNPGDVAREVTFSLHLPAERAIYDDMKFTVNGQPLALQNAKSETVGRAEVPAHQAAVLNVSYRSQGLDRWQYSFGNNVSQVRDFELRLATDFKGFDFLEDTLSPTEEIPAGNGSELVWNYKSLMSGYKIGLALPQKLQPGPLAGRISAFAPVSLLFFFFVLFVLTTIRGIELHPMSYFFLACAFFSFHLLMAYLVDHISIHAAFAICSAASVFLLVSYLRLVAGMRFAAIEAGLAQIIYLILFSYAFFFEGFTGLAITIGAILTLFIAMQMTARIRWSEKFAGQPLRG